jgi:putative phage-type endonuclease
MNTQYNISFSMAKQLLETKIRDWVKQKETNGIKQHDNNWLKARINTIGGSSIATIQGLNPYSSVKKLVKEKIGLADFQSNIMMQWGNLFESVMKSYVEYDKKCTVLGEDLYIEGKIPSVAYSPDGLAAMELPARGFDDDPEEVDTKIVLCEFKCPFSRIPLRGPPKYYVPQVKMGLDVLNFPDIGLLAEGVFRRCSFGDLGFNPAFNKTPAARVIGNTLAYGLIWFSCPLFPEPLIKWQNDVEALADSGAAKEKPLPAVPAGPTKEDPTVPENPISPEEKGKTAPLFLFDFGKCPEDLLTAVLDQYNKGSVQVTYSTIIFRDTPTEIPFLLAQHEKMAATPGVIGFLPWKLFYVKYNFIEKESDYITPWLPKIIKITDIIAKCNECDSNEKKISICDELCEGLD